MPQLSNSNMFHGQVSTAASLDRLDRIFRFLEIQKIWDRDRQG